MGRRSYSLLSTVVRCCHGSVSFISPESSKKYLKKTAEKKKKKDYRLRKKDKGWRLVSLASAFAARLIAAFSTALIDTISADELEVSEEDKGSNYVCVPACFLCL